MAVGAIMTDGVALLRRRATMVLIWSVVASVLALCAASASAGVARDVLLAKANASQMAGMGQGNAGLTIETMGRVFIVQLVHGLWWLLLYAAIVRAARFSTGDTWAFLRVGGDEGRLFLIGLIFAAAGLAGEIGLGVVTAVLGGIVKLIAGKGAMLGLAISMFGTAMLAAVYLLTRLSLVGVFTLYRERLVLTDAWNATKGRFWTLFDTYALIGLCFALLSWLPVMLTQPDLLAAYLMRDAQAIRSATLARLVAQANGLNPTMALQAVYAAVLTVVIATVTTGAMVSAAGRFGDPDEGASIDGINESPASSA